MADELTSLVNVEDDTPPEPPVAAAPEPAAPAAPEPPADPDEAEAVDLPAGKHVPLAALKTVREENKLLRDKAAYAEQLATRLAQMEGQLQGYQQVTEQLKRTPVPAPVAQPQTDEHALSFARSLDLYRQDQNGQAVPDVEKAQSILGIVRQMARQEAGTVAGPVAQAAARNQAIANYQWAITQKDASGKVVDKAVIDQMWRQMPLENTSDPQFAAAAVMLAMGANAMHAKPAPAVPPPPVVTEGVGGAPRPRQAMSDLEQRIAKDRGVDASKWQELTKGFKQGHTNVLED
jgi:hypothetical protein